MKNELAISKLKNLILSLMALQAELRGGEGRALTNTGQNHRPVVARRDFDVFTRQPMQRRGPRVRFGPL